MRLGFIAFSLLGFILTGCGGGDRPINKDLDMPKASTKDKDKAEPKAKS